MKRITGVLFTILFLLTLDCLAQRDRDKEFVTTKSFSVSKGGMLDISVNGGDIHITPWDKNEVLIKIRGIDDEDLEDVSMTLDGKNTVRIDDNSTDDWLGDARFDINVPSHFDLDLRTNSGLIDIQGSLSGKVRGMTSAGDVRLGNITGTVDMNTSGGNIRSGEIQGNLLLKTSGGDIRVGTVTGEADVNTSGGNIQMENIKKTLWARTSGGDIVIGDVGGEATISTSGGNIVVGKVSGSAKLSTSGGDIDLQGASGSVRAKTSGGNVRLLNITGSIDAKTGGGDVEAELIPSGKGGSRLSTASGVITLFLPSSAKTTIDARIRVDGGWRYQKDEYRIHSAFPSTAYEADRQEHEIHGTYTLNGGGETIFLETVNADIEIRKLTDRPRE